MKKIIFALAAGTLMVACKEKETAAPRMIEKAEWLIGTWENISAQGNLSETWNKENDSVYSGQTYFIKDKDTLHSETIALNQSGADLIYTPIVKGQNDGKPVSFKLTSSTSNQLVFENPAHDFPKKIVYNKITNDSLVAEISGTQQGKSSIEQFPMKRK